MFNWIKKQAIQKRVEDAILYEYVADELEDGVKVKGLWAKAYAQSGGDSDAVEPLYMQYRVQSIKDLFTAMKIAYEELPKNEISKYLTHKDSTYIDEPNNTNDHEDKIYQEDHSKEINLAEKDEDTLIGFRLFLGLALLLWGGSLVYHYITK